MFCPHWWHGPSSDGKPEAQRQVEQQQGAGVAGPIREPARPGLASASATACDSAYQPYVPIGTSAAAPLRPQALQACGHHGGQQQLLLPGPLPLLLQQQQQQQVQLVAAAAAQGPTQPHSDGGRQRQLTPYATAPHAPTEVQQDSAAAEPLAIPPAAVLPQQGERLTTLAAPRKPLQPPPDAHLPTLPLAAMHAGGTAAAAASAAVAPAAPPPVLPAGYWEDRYQLPFAALRCDWPQPPLLQLVAQQADCLYDYHLPAALPQSAAAAVRAAAAAVAAAEAAAHPTCGGMAAPAAAHRPGAFLQAPGAAGVTASCLACTVGPSYWCVSRA